VLFFVSLVIPHLDFADDESQRYLRNGIHFYETKEFRRSKSYFLAALADGTPKEQAVAKRYLKTPELKRNAALPGIPRPLSPEMERIRHLLQKGITLYEAGKYEDAAKYLKTVAEEGGKDQQIIAKSYLLRPEMERGREGLLDEPEPAAQKSEKESAFPVQFSGYLSEQAAYRVARPMNWSLLRTTAFGSGTGKITDDITYKISGRAYYDAVYDLTHQYPSAVADDQRQEFTLRDTYVDLSHGNWDARIGNQQIIWGEAIGAFVADVVNARDLRESVLPSFDFIRIPQWGIDAEYSRSDVHVEGVWLPLPEMDKIPLPGSEFAPLVPAIPGIQFNIAPEKKPDDSIANSEVGGRLSYRAGGWDVSGFFFRTWDKLPVYEQELSPGAVTLTPIHPRLTIDGLTFSKEIDAVVIKGEFAYYQGKYFSTSDLSDSDGLVKKDYYTYLLAADHTFENEIEVNAQLSQTVIRRYQSDLTNQKPTITAVSAHLGRSFFSHHVDPGLELIVNFPYTDYLIRPSVGFNWAEHWRSDVGLDLFGGSAQGPFGQFANKKRVVMNLRYDF